MKILVLTQKIDKNDDALGFFHSWVAELALQYERVIVVCLEKGLHDLPLNVDVFSLGKELRKDKFSPLGSVKGIFNRAIYLVRFYILIFRNIRKYDKVFVHMNSIYIIFGWPVWKFFGKKTGLWCNHPKGSWIIDLAVRLADTSFCTSSFAYLAKFKKTILMPVGIKTEDYGHESSPATQRSILFLGRITPIKKVEVFLEALTFLQSWGFKFSANIIGDPDPGQREYYDGLKKLSKEKGLDKYLVWLPAIPHHKTPLTFRKYELFVNLTPTGSMDKTIFEAMASKVLVIISNKSLSGQISENFITDNKPEEIAQKIVHILTLSEVAKEKYREDNLLYVSNNHSLKYLVSRLKVLL